jgi:thioredoxin-related protein
MKMRRPGLQTALLLLGALFALVLAPSVMAAGSAVNWNTYDSGMKKIKNQNKKGFIHFYTDWCTYCKLMNQKTFSDDSVAAYLNDNFIPIRINADQQREVAEEFGVQRFPNNWFIAEDHSNIGRRPGFIPAETLLQMLKYVDSDSFRKMSFQDYMDNHK